MLIKKEKIDTRNYRNNTQKSFYNDQISLLGFQIRLHGLDFKLVIRLHGLDLKLDCTDSK